MYALEADGCWRLVELTHGAVCYLGVLFSHLSLCMAVPVMAIRLIVLGLRGELPKHRRLARWAWPIWLYVSVTGVIIYLMLYPLSPAAL